MYRKFAPVAEGSIMLIYGLVQLMHTTETGAAFRGRAPLIILPGLPASSLQYSLNQSAPIPGPYNFDHLQHPSLVFRSWIYFFHGVPPILWLNASLLINCNRNGLVQLLNEWVLLLRQKYMLQVICSLLDDSLCWPQGNSVLARWSEQVVMYSHLPTINMGMSRAGGSHCTHHLWTCLTRILAATLRTWFLFQMIILRTPQRMILRRTSWVLGFFSLRLTTAIFLLHNLVFSPWHDINVGGAVQSSF